MKIATISIYPVIWTIKLKIVRFSELGDGCYYMVAKLSLTFPEMIVPRYRGASPSDPGTPEAVRRRKNEIVCTHTGRACECP